MDSGAAEERGGNGRSGRLGGRRAAAWTLGWQRSAEGRGGAADSEHGGAVEEQGRRRSRPLVAVARTIAFRKTEKDLIRTSQF